MRGLIKIALSTSAATFTVGVLATAFPTLHVAYAAAAATPVIIGGKYLVDGVLYLGSKCISQVKEKYHGNKDTLGEIAHNINPFNAVQNTTLLSTLGSALGTSVALATEKDPRVGAGVGFLVGFTSGYLLPDNKIGNVIEKAGITIARQGTSMKRKSD